MRYGRPCSWLVVASCLLVLGCASENAQWIERGGFEGTVYHHGYLGLTLNIPPNWSIQDQQVLRQMEGQGVEMLAGDNKNLQAVLRASGARTVPLLTVLKYARGAPVSFNPSIAAAAESVSHLPGVQTGGDYLFHARRFLEAGRVKYSFPHDISMQTIGGVKFHVLYGEIALLPRLIVKQELYTTIRKGYALTVMLTYGADEERNELRSILDTMTFAPLE